MTAAVFLDRDNTLIANDGDLGDPAALVLLDGAASAAARLHDAGFRLVVVSNQGGVARGLYSPADVERVHDALGRMIAAAAGRDSLIDAFYFCPYHPDGTVEAFRGEHPWRKPQPGMLLQAAGDLGIDLEASWMVGDQPRDIEAGRAAGCRTILLGSASETADHVVGTLSAAADVVLEAGSP